MSAKKARAGTGSFRRRGDGWECSLWVGSREDGRRFYGYGRTQDDAYEDAQSKAEAAARAAIGDETVETVGDFFRWWLEVELVERVADGTMEEGTRRFYAAKWRLAEPHIGQVLLAELKEIHVRELLSKLRREKTSNDLRERVHATLRAGLSCAVRYQMVERNVVKNVEAPRVPTRARKDEVPLAHVRALLDAAKFRPLRALYLLALHVPLRPGELVGAEEDCFDLDAAVFDVRQNLIRVPLDEEVLDQRKKRRSAQRWELHDTKGHKRREVPLPPSVVQALRDHLEIVALERGIAGDGWTVEHAWVRDDEGQWASRPLDRLVFPRVDGRTPGAPIKPYFLEDDLKALCAAAGVPSYTPHRLRHAAKTLLTSKGVDPHVVQQLGGWADLQTANLYTGKLTKAMREAVDALAEDLE